MNREERRKQIKILRKNGLNKEQAKKTINTYYMGDQFKSGQKVKFNWELIIRNPYFKKQIDGFKNWVISHKDDVLTIDKVRNNNTEVTFVEDTQDKPFWHKTMTLIPVASATINLNDGTTKSIILDGVSDVNDPNILSEINKAMEEN